MKAKRVRANGEGTIYQNPNKSFTAQITTPDGKRPSFTHASQRKVRSWLTQQRREIDTGEYIEPSDMTLSAWWDKWVETYKRTNVSTASMTTFRQSRARLNKHYPKLMKLSLSALSAVDIQMAINSIHDAGRSDRTCELTLVHLRDCLNKAVKLHMMRLNPANDVDKPSSHTQARNVVKELPDALYDDIVSELTRPVRIVPSTGKPDQNDMKSKSLRDALFFALRTGCRRGEVCGLRWEDIRWTEKKATIARSIDEKKRVSLPKTNEIDDVPLTDDVIAMLQSRRFMNFGYVFANANETPVEPHNLLRKMRELAPGYGVHTLRKTFSSRAARSGVNPKTLQTMTRHKSLNVLLKFYTAVTDDDRAEAAAKISSYCKSTANPANFKEGVSK